MSSSTPRYHAAYGNGEVTYSAGFHLQGPQIEGVAGVPSLVCRLFESDAKIDQIIIKRDGGGLVVYSRLIVEARSA